MRIAVVTASFLPRVGGAEFAVHYLAQEWAARGHEVVVLNHVTQVASRPEARYDVRQYRRPPASSHFPLHGRFNSWFVGRQLNALLKELAPDVISAHFAYPVAVWLQRLKAIPRFIVTAHGPALNQTAEGPRHRYGIDDVIAGSMNAASHVIAISSHARRVMTDLGVEPARIVDIPNGAEVERFGRTVNGYDLRTRFDLPTDAVVVLSVGRDTWAKDYRTGLQAFAAAARQSETLYYLLVGRGIEASWGPLAEELGVTDRVRFSDGLFGDDLVATYQQADVFFLPSAKELCPLVVPEAMAAGLPAVVTNVSGSQDMVHHGSNGLVAEPGDAAALGEALARLADDADQRRQLGLASRARSSSYSWTHIADRYLKLMESP